MIFSKLCASFLRNDLIDWLAISAASDFGNLYIPVLTFGKAMLFKLFCTASLRLLE